jgi:hypothetical protein
VLETRRVGGPSALDSDDEEADPCANPVGLWSPWLGVQCLSRMQVCGSAKSRRRVCFSPCVGKMKVLRSWVSKQILNLIMYVVSCDAKSASNSFPLHKVRLPCTVGSASHHLHFCHSK